jgi:alkanesulfonate monooxygenase SsuD/methylene tetrahydromethanopterin reductase-like flavin-dependent oxidoreductase (luciferase family)
MGLKAIPLKRFETYVRRVQALLAGETIEWDHEGERRKIRFLNPDFGLINLDDTIRLHLSAFGPKARALTARLSAGWLNFGADVERATRELSEMRDAWQRAGRTSDLYSTFFSLGCVLRDGESPGSERAIAQAGPLVAVFFHNLVETTEPGQLSRALPPAMNDALERYRRIYQSYQPDDARYLTVHRGHLMFVRPEERPCITPELVASLSMTGTRAQLRDRLRSLARAGYSQFAIQVVEHHESALEEWADVFALV